MDICRNKCRGCYRQFNKKEHLVEHMRISYHSAHEPTCGICNKHCRSFDSLREHLIGIYIIRNVLTVQFITSYLISFFHITFWIISYVGPLPKQECKNIFNICGCRFCLTILESPNARRIHQERCQLSNVSSVIIIFPHIK